MLSIILFAYAGFSALCLSLSRHYRQVRGRVPSANTVLALRLAGWILLALSLLLCMWLDKSWSLALVTWAGSLSAAGLWLVFLLPYRPQASVAIALITPLIGFYLLLY